MANQAEPMPVMRPPRRETEKQDLGAPPTPGAASGPAPPEDSGWLSGFQLEEEELARPMTNPIPAWHGPVATIPSRRR